MNRTTIEWVDRPGTTPFTWNPIRAMSKSTGRSGTFCTRISPGCRHCYASVINRRFGTGLPFEVPHLGDHEFYVDERILQEPLRRKKPATIFVGDMMDLFHEAIPDKFIVRVFEVMAQASQHTFQVLTKRAERMSAWSNGLIHAPATFMATLRPSEVGQFPPAAHITHTFREYPWPLPNVWLGTSVESQKYADERTRFLRDTPADVRFLSIEPQLERIVLPAHCCPDPAFRHVNINGGILPLKFDWVIVGGESGPGARPFNVQWAEDLLLQCRRSGIAFFMKQLGSNAGYISNDVWAPIAAHSKGGDLNDIPESLRVREWPR